MIRKAMRAAAYLMLLGGVKLARAAGAQTRAVLVRVPVATVSDGERKIVRDAMHGPN